MIHFVTASELAREQAKRPAVTVAYRRIALSLARALERLQARLEKEDDELEEVGE